MPRIGSIMLTNLSRYAGPRMMEMPKIMVNRPIVFARISSGISFASRSRDKIYVSSESPELFGPYLSRFLHQKYVPDHIPAENKSTCFKSDIDNFLRAIKERNIKRKGFFGENTSTSRNNFSTNLSDSLRLYFITEPRIMPAGLDLISKAWALFEMAPETKLRSTDGNESPIDRLEQRLRNFIFVKES
jgi:hypothetical protein